MTNHSVGRMRRVALLSTGLLLLTCIQQAFADDVVTLNSEEIITGRIVDNTESNISIVVGNYNNTIFVTKVIAKSDIKTLERETAEQKKEKADFAAIGYKLDPNQEYTEAQYNAGIAAFNKFLTDHPASHFNDEINKRIATWNEELSNLQSGKVKFADRWITPDEKRIASDTWRKQKRVQDDLVAVQNLKHQLDQLQITRRQTVEGIGADQAKLGSAQAQLANLQDQTTLQTVGGGSGGHWEHNQNGIAYWVKDRSGQSVVAETTVNPDRARLAASVGGNQGQVASGQMVLSDLDNQIAATQSKLDLAQNEYRVAQAQAQIVLAPTPPPPPKIVVVEAPAPPPPPPPPPPAPEPSWYMKIWNKVFGIIW